MNDRAREDHVAAGWNDVHDRRWIQAGHLRVEEDTDGALVTMQNHKGSSLSAAELAGLARHLAGWFADDPTDTIRQIEGYAKRVKAELEAWNDRARTDEEHPPYDDLTRVLGNLLACCRSLREDIGKFADAPKIITVKEGT